MKVVGVRILIYVLAAVFFNGCSIPGNWHQLMTLKRLGNNRRRAELYIEKQEKLFYVLLDDVRSNRLEQGLPKGNILNKYGDPVLYRGAAAGDSEAEELLYRHPTQYFSSERIYMYFDRAGKLARWEYYPSQ